MPQRLLSLLLLSALVLMAGCAQQLKTPPPEQQLFLLDAACPIVAREQTPVPGVLVVRPMLVSPGYATRHLIYRRGADRYEDDYYNLFLARPEQLSTQCLMRCLAESGLFEQVLQPGSVLSPNYVLESSLTAIYADFHDGNKAVLRTQFFLLKAQDLNLAPVWQGRFEMTAPIADPSPAAVVAAMNQTLAKTIVELEQGIAGYLKGRE